MQYTGAKILMECLVEQGVDTIFGYPGGTILNVYDELYNYEGEDEIEFVDDEDIEDVDDLDDFEYEMEDED